MTYDASSPTDKDRVRALIGDTSNDAAKELLSDDEISNVFLDLAGGNVFGAAAMACWAIAGSQARSALAWDVLGRDVAVDRRSVPREFRLLAQQLQGQADALATPGDITWGDANMDQLLDGVVLGGIHDYQHLTEDD